MALKHLTEGDFSYFKSYNDDMRRVHEEEFLQRADPDLMRALYRGESGVAKQGEQKKFLSMNRMFAATNTIMPNLYWQNPKLLGTPKEGTDPVNAAIMTSLVSYYMNLKDENGYTWKHTNQEAIMNTYFFGIGWKKIGYHTAFEPADNQPENKLDAGEKLSIGIRNILGTQPDNLEARTVPQYVRYETLFNTNESPSEVLVDHNADIRTYRIITHRVKRSLHDLRNFGNYDEGVINELLEKALLDKGTRFDERDVMVDLNEMTIQQRNGIWVLTFVDQMDKPLRYEKSTSLGRMPWSPLVFTYEPGVRYPVSHMKVASKIQTTVDKIANLAVEVVSKLRNQHYVNETVLSHGQKQALEKNRIGGILLMKRTLQTGDIGNIASHPISADLFGLMNAVTQSLTENLGAAEQIVAGKSRNKTLGQDKIAALGTEIRESGMLDKVRDWVIDQAEKAGEVLQQYSNAKLNLMISPKDFANPLMSELVQQQWQGKAMNFGTAEQPLGPRHFIQGNFQWTVNIYEAVKPNKPALRGEYMEALTLLVNPAVEQLLLRNGKVFRGDKLVEQIMGSFENIEGEQFLEDVAPSQVAAIQTMQALQAGGGQVPQQTRIEEVEKVKA